jgi:quercetin dioxygenase-like cupin family protein
MIVREHRDVATHTLPGLQHQTVAGRADGLRRLEVWVQRMAPGAETPWHRHECEEVVVVLQGGGRCEADGGAVVRFGPESTLIVPSGAVHRIVNDGDVEMVVVASLSTAPVVVEAPDGTPMALPWT